ncbi:hypothetical protein AB0L15_36010, partial [Streptomyces sp. NPDC052693]
APPARRPGAHAAAPPGAPPPPPDPERAARAVAALAGSGHGTGSPAAFRRLVAPDAGDRSAAALLRHPDLLAPVAELHHHQLLARLNPGRTLIA